MYGGENNIPLAPETDSNAGAKGNGNRLVVNQYSRSIKVATSSVASKKLEDDVGSGAWQGGDYQRYLINDSCDSSLGAWSEDEHKEHINSKKKQKGHELQRRKRHSTSIQGTLKTQKDESSKCLSSNSNLKIQAPFSSHLAASHNAQSPGQISDTFSSPFASPLQYFPTLPARGSAGRLVVALISSPSQSPLSPKGYFQHKNRPPQQNRLVIKNQSPLIRQLSQSKVDDSPLDVPLVMATGWTVQEDEEEFDKNDRPDDSPTALIDSLMLGVQEEMIASKFVYSPESLSSASSAQSDWETDDCEITPRLRARWEESEPITRHTPKNSTQNNEDLIGELTQGESSSLTKTVSRRQPSFIRVPSAIFPHTPVHIKRVSLEEKRASTFLVSSVSLRSSKGSWRVTSRKLSSQSSTLGTRRRRSAQTLSPLPSIFRKSKYYSRPLQPGMMPQIVQQYLKGARGKFWSPMNSIQVPKVEAAVGIGEEGGTKKSVRYSRRSGQEWVRPRTFEVKDQLRVTIYPPRVEELQKQENDAVKDPDKTPTQAEFNKLKEPSQRPLSRTSKSSHGLPLLPPPNVSLPPVPTLRYGPMPKKLSSRTSRQSKLHLSQSESTTTCSHCPSFSCSCSQSWTETICSSSTRSQSDRCSGNQTCSCTTSSACTMTRSEMGLIRSPQSASLCPSFSIVTAMTPVPPHSAPYSSSQHPPVLSPLPHFSPFYIDFDHILGFKSIKTKVSMDSAQGYYSGASYSDCTTCYEEGRCRSCFLTCQSGPPTMYGSSNEAESSSYDSSTMSPSSQTSEASNLYNDSDQDSDLPLTPPRSEYQSSLGYLESPGYRVSCIVSPMPQSAKRLSEMQILLEMKSPPNYCLPMDIQRHCHESIGSNEGSVVSEETYTTSSSSTSNLTYSSNGEHRVPRSILKTSKYRDLDKELQGGVGERRMAANTLSNSVSSFSYKSNSGPQRATLATSTLTKCDLRERIQREENRRKRNESRLYALEKLEGKTKKSSLFLSLLSNSTTAGNAGGTMARLVQGNGKMMTMTQVQIL